MRVVFVIQGEGRGHLTQALALHEELNKYGIKLLAVVVGKSTNRQIPDFFINKIDAPIVKLDSPNFVFDSKMKGVNMPATILKNLKKLPAYFKSVKKLSDILRQYDPKLVINFYEPLVGLSKVLNKNPYPVFSIAHQYIFEHPKYIFPKGFISERLSIINYTKFTSKGSLRKYALSLYDLNSTVDNIKVIPPLLRNGIYNLVPEDKGFILVYLLNEGYLEEIRQFKLMNPTLEIHCFTDKKNLEIDFELEPGLWLHKINDILFLEMMSKCKALLTTAGFESIVEAMFLAKPIIMVPLKGHFEQYCNSRDAANAGAGIYSDTFSLNSISLLTESDRTKSEFKMWHTKNKNILVEDIFEYLKSKDQFNINTNFNLTVV